MKIRRFLAVLLAASLMMSCTVFAAEDVAEEIVEEVVEEEYLVEETEANPDIEEIIEIEEIKESEEFVEEDNNTATEEELCTEEATIEGEEEIVEETSENDEMYIPEAVEGDNSYSWGIISDIDKTASFNGYEGDQIDRLEIPVELEFRGAKYKITAIGNNAFAVAPGTSPYTSIIIPSAVSKIGISAFENCSKLTHMTLPDNLISIMNAAFYGCSGLPSISIPASVTEIGENSFENCSGLTNLFVYPQNTKYDSRNNCNAIIETATKTLWVGCVNTVIPNDITKIGEYAFAGCDKLTNITIPNNITRIGRFSFKDCNNLTGIIIPSSVTNIGEYAFANCDKLTIYCAKNSAAETYAKNNNINCINFGWNTIGGKKYYYNSNGVMQTNKWIDNTYYVKADGSMAVSEWIDDNHYVDADGKLVPGKKKVQPVSKKYYRVQFVGNGSTSGSMTYQDIKVNTGTKLKANSFKKKGYTFTGWNTKANGKGKKYSNKASVKNLAKSGKEIKLYAQWKANTYTVKFDKNGGKGSMKNMSMTYGKTKKLSKNKFKRKNYKFMGWATSKSNAKKGKVKYKNSAKISNLTTTNKKTVKLYAVWKKK